MTSLYLEPNWPKGHYRKARAMVGLKVSIIAVKVAVYVYVFGQSTVYMTPELIQCLTTTEIRGGGEWIYKSTGAGPQLQGCRG